MSEKKAIRSYSKTYRKILRNVQSADDAAPDAYVQRLREMYASGQFQAYSLSQTVDTVKIYAVIAMCLELKRFRMTDFQIIQAVSSGFSARERFSRRVLRRTGLLPGSRRIPDGSLVCDASDASGSTAGHCGSGCAYMEIFDAYGIRPLSKIFCF